MVLMFSRLDVIWNVYLYTFCIVDRTIEVIVSLKVFSVINVISEATFVLRKRHCDGNIVWTNSQRKYRYDCICCTFYFQRYASVLKSKNHAVERQKTTSHDGRREADSPRWEAEENLEDGVVHELLDGGWGVLRRPLGLLLDVRRTRSGVPTRLGRREADGPQGEAEENVDDRMVYGFVDGKRGVFRLPLGLLLGVRSRRSGIPARRRTRSGVPVGLVGRGPH